MAKHPKPKNEPETNTGAEQAGASVTEKELDRRNVIVSMNTLSGDLRDFILERLKWDKSPLPWDVQSEAAQKDIIERVTNYSTRFVEKAVEMIAASGRPVMVGTLKKVQVKDGIQCQIDFVKSDPLRHELMDSAGQTVLLVVSNSDPFIGTRGDVKVKPDQAKMDLESEEELPPEPGDEEPPEGGDPDPDAPTPTDKPLF